MNKGDSAEGGLLINAFWMASSNTIISSNASISNSGNTGLTGNDMMPIDNIAKTCLFDYFLVGIYKD